MANATTRDARAGFAIYLQSFEGTTLEEINARLAASGYGAIAQRTFTHYRKLVNAGFNRYISINRFDVARASRAYENMSSLGRYRYRPTRQEINIIFAKGSRFFEARGYVVEVGDVGAMIEFADEPQIVGIQRFKPSRGDRVILSYAGSIEASTGVVVDSDLESAPVLVEIEHARLISVAEIEDVPSLPTTSFRFKLIAGSKPSLRRAITPSRLMCWVEDYNIFSIYWRDYAHFSMKQGGNQTPMSTPPHQSSWRSGWRRLLFYSYNYRLSWFRLFRGHYLVVSWQLLCERSGMKAHS